MIVLSGVILIPNAFAESVPELVEMRDFIRKNL